MFFGTCIQVLTDALEGKAPVLSSFVTADTFANLQQAARLCPDNVNLQAGFASILVMSDALAMSARSDPAKDLGDTLSERSRAALAEIRPRLETLAARNDPELAAHACEALAAIEFMQGATGNAQKYGRRAVTLNPTRESAWEMLVGMQLKAEHPAELLTVCAERVKVADTIRNRYLLAKAHEQLDHYDKVAEQLDLILKREPDNFLATAGKAAMLLRRGDDAKAAECLQRAATLANNATEPAQRADLLSLQAIHAVLRGDRKTAALHLGQALKLDENNKNARAVLRALGP
jgi:tetratricopeptide (TPR) repeat protein